MTWLQQIVFGIRGTLINRQIDTLLRRCRRPYRPAQQALGGIASAWFIVLALTAAFGAGCVVAGEQAVASVASVDAPPPGFGIVTCIYPPAPPGTIGDVLDRE